MTTTGEVSLTRRNSPQYVSLIAIGSSAGGTEALRKLVTALPKNFPCVIIVQHILAGFIDMFVESINSKSKMNVSVGRGGEPVIAGHVYIAGDGVQLGIQRIDGALYTCRMGNQKITGHCPSVDALFGSVAECAGNEAIGVILTGMGSDGAEGLLQMRRAGAYTIGQDAASCVVYGMPKVAMEKGAVIRQLPLMSIANELITYVQGKRFE